jgi:hypothetical protein
MKMNTICVIVPIAHDNIFFGAAKTVKSSRRIFCSSLVTQENVMPASARRGRGSWFAFAAISVIVMLSGADAAFASQGPGGGLGSASNLTQLVMAIIVWGTSALVVGAGLIGAARGR